MRFVADLHVHSRYSRATSREADLAGYYRWARIKGIDVVGTGDFTHPRWFDELSTNLVEDNGLYRLKDPPRDDVGAPGGSAADGVGGGAGTGSGAGTGAPGTAGAPAGAGRAVRFMLTTEISSIYRKHGQVRKVHTLVCLQNLEEVRRLTVKLAAVGNIASDGRPILGLDPKDLLSMVMEVSPEGFLIPAHVWTPWFSVFGSKSGFDAIEECFEELTPRIFALETGLSSDPPMNWRWSALDRFRLVSNSDAHSPGNLGREANLLDTDPSWTGIRDALKTGTGFLGTMEFYPEEGKYHWDGHRKCGVCMDPEQSARAGGNCPVCGKPLTIGVLNRVLGLADRTAPAQPRPTEGYRYIIPLPELLAELVGTGTGSTGVARVHARVLSSFGSEFAFLLDAPIQDIERSQGPLLAEAVRRMRAGQIDPQPGFDGEFGVIRVFDRAELDRLRGQDELFPVSTKGRGRTAPPPVPAAGPGSSTTPAPAVAAAPAPTTMALDPEQQAVVDHSGARSVVFAGPGTGKTRLLAAWVARHAAGHGAGGALALTFTNRAARELNDRLGRTASGHGQHITASTFHSFCWSILRELDPALTTIITPAYRATLVRELFPGEGDASTRNACERMERFWDGMEAPDPALAARLAAYDAELKRMGAADLGSLVHQLLALLRANPALAADLTRRWPTIAVDELQDINRAQYELLGILCARAEHVLGIGDPDQAIYAFRGSDRERFFSFRAESGTRSFSLARNYRSTATLVDAAEALIAGERTPGIPPLGSARGPGERVRVVRTANPAEEGRSIAQAITDLVGGVDAVSVDAARQRGAGAYGFSDIAILFRTRAVRDALLPSLAAAGLPLAAGTGAPLTDDEPFRSLAAALRLVADARDAVSRRILARSTGAETVADLDGRRYDLVRLAAERGVAAAMDEIRASVVRIDLADPAVALGWETLRAAAAAYGTDLRGFIAHISLCARESEGPRAVQRISLLTFHAAKGLEFPVVFIAGAEDEVTPGLAGSRGRADRGSRGQQDSPESAEERRLFYVAATRARDMLFITHCARRAAHGEIRAAAPSRFLTDIPTRCRTDIEPLRRPKDSQLPLFG